MATVIVDAGPLVAYLRRSDSDHEWAKRIFNSLTEPLVTCDAALSEAFFLLQEIHGGTEQLLTLLERGIVVSCFDSGAELSEVARLLRKYANVPMSLADACLVRMAELERASMVFTLDADFRIYRKNRRQAISLIFPDRM